MPNSESSSPTKHVKKHGKTSTQPSPTERNTKKNNRKKRKIENGLGHVLVNEDANVPNKKKAKLNHHHPDLGSIHEGKKCFEWMIQPVKFDKFFKDRFLLIDFLSIDFLTIIFFCRSIFCRLLFLGN